MKADDWLRPTACRDWSVKDVAAHILDGQLRRLSFARDRHLPPGPPVTSFEDVVRLINRLNADGVASARRLSPRLLIDQLDWVAPQVAAYFASLQPFETAAFPVAWAGETSSANWFDTAREYTEQWHHQQQIRDAVKAAPLTGRKWLNPVLATFVHSLPHAYRNTSAPIGAVVEFKITGDAGDCWLLRRETSGWKLSAEHADEAPAKEADARVALDAIVAWRLFTRGLTPAQARQAATIEGDEALALVALNATAVM